MLLAFTLTGCHTTKEILDNGTTTTDIRDAVSELQSDQATSAAGAQAISDTVDQVKTTVDRAVGTLESGANEDKEFDALCKQIRDQSLSEK